MARRAISATNPIWFLVAVVLIAGALSVGWWLKSRVSDPFRTLPVLPVNEYAQNGDSLRGNTYKVDGVIGQQLVSRDVKVDSGHRLFEVLVGGDPITILVPPEFNHLDIRKDGRFLFKVEVGARGILRAKDVRKE
jgi:hypothetical protein